MEIIDNLKKGKGSPTGAVYIFDSHDREEYIAGKLLKTPRYDNPCRWRIEGCDDGYKVTQYDLSVTSAEGDPQNMIWLYGMELLSERTMTGTMHMQAVDVKTTQKGAFNVCLTCTENPDRILILLIVSDHIEKIQFADQGTGQQTVYRSAVDKICFLELEEKRAIVQLGYQLIAGASETKTVSETDDETIDILMDGCFYDRTFGTIVWNQGCDYNPYEAFRTVSRMDDSAKAAIKLVLVNMARQDNSIARFDILRKLCIQAGLPKDCSGGLYNPVNIPTPPHPDI